MRKLVLQIMIIATILITSIIYIGVNIDNVHAQSNDYSVKKNGIVTYNATDERLSACERMYQMSSVEWSITKSVEYKYASNKYTTLNAGTYKGLPYTQVNRDSSIPGKIQGYMNSVINDNGAVKGVDCSSAAAYALRYATENNVSNSNYLKGVSSAYVGSSFLYDGMRESSGTATTMSGTKITYRNNLSKIGWYGNYTGYANAGDTKVILSKLCASGNYSAGDVYENVYAKVMPGDVLVRYFKDTDGTIYGHVMLAIRTDLEYTNGKIDPDKSKIFFIDQISPGRSIYTSGAISSWRNDETYNKSNKKRNNSFTIKELATKYYFIPVTAWTPVSDYTITYDINGGANKPSNQIKKPYVPRKLSEAVPQKEGYTFTGWISVHNPVTRIYQPGDYYFEEKSDVLKATWSVNRCTIKYDVNGGTGAPQSQIKEYGTPIYISSVKPVREGYEFVGWSKLKTNNSADYYAGDLYKDDTEIKHTANSVVTLYAIWKENDEITGASVSRIAGKDRFATSIQAANVLKSDMGISKFDNIIIAYGMNFADALPGSYLAAEKNAPVLLIGAGNYSTVKDYVNSNLKPGGTVYVLGGTGVIPDSWVTGMPNVQRLGGKDRYETNLLILDAAGMDAGSDILVCTGSEFADSLSASATGKPILLVGASLNDAQKAYLYRLSGESYYMIGGTGAVSGAVMNEFKAFGTVDRVAGSDRYTTSVEVAKAFFGTPNAAVLAYGLNFPDGLSAGPLAYNMDAPLILTATGSEEQAVSYASAKGIKSGYVIGGSGLISDGTVKTVFQMSSSDIISIK